VAEDFKILSGGIRLDPCKIEIEDIDVGWDGNIGHGWSKPLRCCRPSQKETSEAEKSS
jgi:hypothetical protein